MDLPSPIRRYFDANARLDGAAMAAAFAPDAVVCDEGATRRGAAEIRAWIDATSIGLPAVATPNAVAGEGDLYQVGARVEGSFAGSPITLTFRFRLRNAQIAELEIG